MSGRRRAFIDASNVAVIAELAISLHNGIRREFYALPADHQERLMIRANTILRKLRKVTLDAERLSVGGVQGSEDRDA